MNLTHSLTHFINETTQFDLDSCHLTHAAVSIMVDGEQVFRNFYRTQEDTLYRLASMTKPITAFGILILASRGLLSLDDPVTKYLPSFERLRLGVLNDTGIAIPLEKPKVILTLRHLLSHTNGLLSGPLGVSQTLQQNPAMRTSLANVVDTYPDTLLSFEPGSSAAYSAVAAFDVLARIIELVSGIDYPTFLQQEIFIPLGMKNTTFVPSEDQWSRMVPMHNRCEGKNVFDEMGRFVFEDFPLTYPAGGAGLAGTLDDYEKFAQALLHRGVGLLDPKWINEMATPQAKYGIPGLSKTEIWGLGVRIITNDPVLPKGCFGWSGAYGTHFWVDPSHQLTCVYMKNSRFDGGSEAGTARRLEKAVMNALNENNL